MNTGVKDFVYSFYADFYWILNFIMNLFLVWLVAFIRRKEYTPFRWAGACAVVAFISVIHKISVLELRSVVPDGLYCVFSVLLLTGLSYKYKGNKKKIVLTEFLSDMVILLFGVSITAGCLLFMQEHMGGMKSADVKKAFIFNIISFAILYALFFIMRNIIKNEAKKCETIMCAVLIHENVKKSINVLYDTGNNLFSPYTNEPVNIISKETAIQMGVRDKQKPLLIPYNSIGGSGLLETYRFEKLIFMDGSIMMNFLGAVSERVDKTGDVQMILNCSCKKIKGHGTTGGQ